MRLDVLCVRSTYVCKASPDTENFLVRELSFEINNVIIVIYTCAACKIYFLNSLNY